VLRAERGGEFAAGNVDIHRLEHGGILGTGDDGVAAAHVDFGVEAIGNFHRREGVDLVVARLRQRHGGHQAGHQ
jgi:hypothetical protein